VSDPATRRMAARVAGLGVEGLSIRPATDADGPRLTALVSAAYDEYRCGPLDPQVFDADLAAPATAAAASGRSWWVLTLATAGAPPALVGSVAHGPVRTAADGGRTVELHRLYLAPGVRGVGLAGALLEGVAAEARRAGAGTLEAWSDTRLSDAHARYLATGFHLTGASRELGDPAGTTELLFVRSLDPELPPKA
jgi:GNAT superfamily N-acetyltransferase